MSPVISSRRVLFLLLPLFAAARAGASDYYVSLSGSDSNVGSSFFPFRQIRRALTAAVPGDTIFVADGSYLGFDVAGKNGTPPPS